MLSYEEIEYVCEIFVALGIQKIRLTGGEPMLRRDIETIIGKLAKLKTPVSDMLQLVDDVPEKSPALENDELKHIGHNDKLKHIGHTGLNDLALTTNGYFLPGRAHFAAFAREHDVKMRFIEFMPLDSGHEWSRADVFTGREIREAINAQFPLVPIDVARGSETSSRYRFADGAPGEIGIIAPVSEPFCGACSRIRLTADGQIRTCLFSTVEHSLRDVVRSGATRAEIIDFIEAVVLKKEPRHYINDPGFVAPSRTMSFIGG